MRGSLLTRAFALGLSLTLTLTCLWMVGRASQAGDGSITYPEYYCQRGPAGCPSYADCPNVGYYCVPPVAEGDCWGPSLPTDECTQRKVQCGWLRNCNGTDVTNPPTQCGNKTKTCY